MCMCLFLSSFFPSSLLYHPFSSSFTLPAIRIKPPSLPPQCDPEPAKGFFLLQGSLFLPLVSFVDQALSCCQAPGDDHERDRCFVNKVKANGSFL